jgi:hypothetical protein
MAPTNLDIVSMHFPFLTRYISNANSRKTGLGLVHLILAAHTIEKVQMLFRSDRCVPERKVWYVPSLVQCVPAMTIVEKLTD